MKSGGPLKRGGPINQVSKKRARANRLRAKVREEVLSRDGFTCRARGGVIAGQPKCRGELEVHEVIGRGRGGGFHMALDPDNCLTLCQHHHQWVTRNPAEATTLGFLGSLPPSTPVGRVEPTTDQGDQ